MPTTIRNEKLFCLNCGDSNKINYPIGVSDLTEKMEAFERRHKNCEPTWEEPVADQSLPPYDRAMWWMREGEQGSSSLAMWQCFMTVPQDKTNHPLDPDDFKRCYKLLQAVPEWKNHLHKLKPLSPQWSNLVDNWDKLTAMFEQNVAENWENEEKIGMYEFMQTLTEK